MLVKGNINGYFAVVLMVIAIMQPVFAGAHLVHLSQTQVADHHTHASDRDTVIHAHVHHHAAHIDLTFDCLNVMFANRPDRTAIMLSEYQFYFQQISQCPDNPPPILG